MTWSLAIAAPRTLHRSLCVALIGVYTWRFLAVAANWIAGVAPAYPGQYEDRLLSAIIGVGIVGATLLTQNPTLQTRRGRLAYGSLLGAALIALVGQVLIDR